VVAGDIRSKKASLDGKNLKFKHVVHGSVKWVLFHPNSKLALATLFKNQPDFFELDGGRNRRIQNIKIPYTNKPFCSYKPDGNHIKISSENYRGNFYSYDMVSGAIRKHALKVGKDSKDITDFVIHADYVACRYEGNSEIIVISSKTYETFFYAETQSRPKP